MNHRSEIYYITQHQHGSMGPHNHEVPHDQFPPCILLAPRLLAK